MNLRRLFSGKKDLFGLDIGSSCVKAVQLRQDEQGYELIAAGRAEVVQHDNVNRMKTNALVAAIRKCVKAAEIKTKYAVCAICGPDVAARRFKFPALARKSGRNPTSSRELQVSAISDQLGKRAFIFSGL